MFNTDSQKEFSKIRKKRVIEILKHPPFSEDDYVFVDNYIKTYFPEPSKALKNILNKEGLKKVYQGIKYKELKKGDKLFSKEDFLKNYFLIVEGTIEIISGIEYKPEGENNVIKAYPSGTFINPNEIQYIPQSSEEFIAVCSEDCDLLSYEKELYDSIIAENTTASKESRLNAVCKTFIKVKKADRGSKEDYIQKFKPEKFSKGTVIVNPKSKVEEIYIIESGKVLLCATNETNKNYQRGQFIFGVLEPATTFNEWPLLFDKPSPYFAICMEDVEVLSLEKANLALVTDGETLNDLRANTQCKYRLQTSILERLATLSSAEVERNQSKVCGRINVELKDVSEVFSKFDPKSKDSHQFMKNLEKFNKAFGKGTDLKSAISGPTNNKASDVFATPRIVSKDPNFKNLDPQRQRALLALRNEGASRRLGNLEPQKKLGEMNKDDIMKMQSRLLKEEKAEMEKLAQKKNISEKLGLNKLEEAKPSETEAPKDEQPKEQEAAKEIAGPKVFGKMKLDNTALLARFKFGVPEKKPEEEAKKDESEGKEPENKEAEPKEKPVEEQQPIISQKGIENPKPSTDADELGLKITKRNLSNLLNPSNPIIRPQNDSITKKKINAFKNMI